MDEMDADGVFVLEVQSQMFGAIDRAVLPARAAERDLKVVEAAFDKPLYMMVHQSIDGVQES